MALAALGPAPEEEEAIPYPMRGERNQNPPDIGLIPLLLEDLRTHRPTLEDVFMALTGKHIRDE